MNEPTLFDRFADHVNQLTSKAWFFALCVLVVVLWAPSFLIISSIDTWQLIINTTTTIVTFLLVALQQNAQTRADAAVQDKLNGIAHALCYLADDADQQEAVRLLRQTIGLEKEESSA